ncbi:hypothetical protein M0812_28625 [Anaeramoeba flamelloides]|uniref:Uncharacterized protein n=1 Tax=Anaeramoeba flamelloides TaxID=1746091 RepID=A0AAV7YDI5_9EUKA|nr:hypothetical protein M0812_28625 [Anaeramoeba flamelloides]
MNTITEKYIPIIKITKNLMEVIFKKFNVSYDEQKNCDKSPNTDWIPFSNGEHEFEENFILNSQVNRKRIIRKNVKELSKKKKKKKEKREKEKEGEKEKEIEIEIEIEEESEKTKKTKNKKHKKKNEQLQSIVNLIQHIIKKIDQLEENQTNMMKIVESQRKKHMKNQRLI